VPLEEIDAAPFHSLLSCLSKAGQWEPLLDIFALMPVAKRTRVTRQIVLQGLGKAGKAELIATMRHELLDDHAADASLPPASNSAAPSQPLRVLEGQRGDEAAADEDEDEEAEGDEGAEVVQVLQRMPPESKAGTLLDKLREAPAMAGLYSVARFYASVMRIDEAIGLLDELEGGLASSPNSSAQAQGLYNAILKALTKEGRWQQADEVLRRMVVRGVPRSLTTYQTLLRMREEADSVNDGHALARLEAQAKADGVDLGRLATAKGK
jgi:pentatricopeptide repeat protein